MHPGRAVLLSAVLLLSAATLTGFATSAPEAEPFLVGFHTVPDEARQGSFHGEPVQRIDEALRFAVVRAADPRGFEQKLAHDPNVRYARVDEPDAYRALSMPNDPRVGEQYAWSRVNASAAWSITLGSTAVVIAVIDSGIERNHEDLAGRILQGRDFVGGDNDPQDDCGHGTHVAGTAGATSNNGIGVAGAAQSTILPVKVLNSYCAGSWSNVASGIRYAADQGARVISLSLGCGVSCYDQAAADAMEYAWGKGALIVVAAGNEGPCEGCIGFPANHPRALAVGCTDAADARCGSSSAGAAMVMAPGLNILSTTRGNSYGFNSGTSMSAPHVAGAAALALAKDPALTNAQLRARIESSAKDLGLAGPDATFGHGLLDIGALLASTASAPAPAPTVRGVDLSPADSTAIVAKGATVVHPITVKNTGSVSDTILLSKSGVSGGWKATLSASSVTLAPGASTIVTLAVKAPRSASLGAGLTVTVEGVSKADATARDAVSTRTTVG